MVPDIEEAKQWYSTVFGKKPYFDQPFYVGFNIGGFELDLQPIEGDNSKNQKGGVKVYWGVDDIKSKLNEITENHGAQMHEELMDVGDGIYVAAVLDPYGNILGLIQNPHFKTEI